MSLDEVKIGGMGASRRRVEDNRFIRGKGIESRPIISGNLLQQPFLKKYYVPGEFDVADMLHRNAFYIGNNQFVDKSRLDVLEGLLQHALG